MSFICKKSPYLLFKLFFYNYIYICNVVAMHQSNATVYLPSGYDSSHSLHLPPSPVSSSSSSSSSSTTEQDQLNLFRLIEESPNGTEIIGVSKYLHQYISVHLQQFLTTNNIKMDVNNNDNFFSNDKFQFNFQLLDIHDPLTNALHLNPLNGQLTIQKRIDRESICSGNKLINNHHINNDIMIDSSHGSSSQLSLNGRPPIFLHNTLNMNKYLNNLGYFTNPMNMISSNLNKKCIKALNILSTIQILEINEVNVKKIPIDLLIIDINDNNPIWISINNGINDNGNNNHHQHNYTTINNDKIPNIIVQISEIPNNIHEAEDHSRVKQRYQLSRISLPRAYDPDEGINSQLTYHLQSIKKSINYRNDHDPKQPSNDPNDDIPFILEDIPNGPLELVSTMNLDYELKQYYEFYLLAIDNGQPQRTGTAYIKINIIDVNDHSPIFDQPIFYPPNKGISEKTLPGTIIINLTATDQDVSKMNNRIHYKMIPGTLAMNYFNVQSNGLIILKRWLDYETMETSLTDNQLLLNSLLFNRPTQTTPYALNDNNNNDIDMNTKEKYKKQFIFQVKAVDSAPQPYELTSTALVIIPVMDENDEAPIITVKFLGTTEMTSYGETGVIKENVQPPIQLAYVQVRDLDFDGNDQVNCILTDNVNFSLKPTNSLNQFHYQNNEINDPLQLQSSLSISQSTSTSKTDYILNLMTKPDREKNPLYFLRIKCIDQASNFNEQTIRLRILDINDEQPKFQKSIYRFNLPENSDKQLKPIGYYRLNKSSDAYITNQSSTIKGILDERKEYKSDGIEDHYEYRIGRVLAEDNDQGDNARIEYYLDEYFLEIRSSVSSVLPSAYLLINKQTRIEDKNLFIYHNENNNNHNNNHGNNEHNHELVRVDQLFRIDSHTGILYALKKFDGENVDMFRFNVFALDQPNQLTSIRHSGTAIVEIKITDVNDWPPLFILTNQTNLNNTDTTNTSSSSIKSKQQYLNNRFKSENLTVDDDDDHHHHREDELHFVNNYIFHVKENKPAYWLIGRIMAIDLDIESKAMTNKIFNPSKTPFISSSLSYITLRISNDSPLIIRRTFNLHSTNGYLRTSISLDREKQNIYVFNIIAYDGNPSTMTSQTSTATVTVIVDDENDNDPVFIRPAISTTALSSKSESKLDLVNNKLVNNKKENELQTKQFDHLKVNWPASHDDHHHNGDNQLKQINQGANNNDNNNVIQQTMPFNYNDKSNIPVVLVHRTEKSNDFINGEGEASSLTESRPLLQIEATDADINENAKITYEIGAGNTDNLFVLNSDTGILSLSPNLYSQSDHFIQPLEQNINLNQNPTNPIAYVLRFEACDHGIPKRCATPVWVQLVIDPNEFPHLVRLPHLTNYLNPSLVTNRNKLNNPSSSVGQTIIGHIEPANMPMLPGHVNSNLNVNNHNNNNNNIGSHQRMNGQENSASSSMESNKRYPPKFTQFKNIWDLKSSLDHPQNDKHVGNQYPSGYHQLSDLKRGKHRGIIQPYPYGHDENYITNHNNNDGNNQSNSFVISEVAVICLIIVFIILLIAIMVLIYLTRRKTLLLPVPTSKSYLKDGTFRSNPNGCNLKSNQDNNETICAPIELSRNTASFYPVMPDNMISATDITINSNEVSCINDRSIGATEKSITLSTDMLQNPHDSYPLIQGNSEPRLVFNTTLNRPTPQSPLLTSELQNNLNKSTYSPQCVQNPIHSRFDVENEYQCLAPTVDNRISHISRCLTPFFDQRSHQTIQNIEAIGLNQVGNNYRNCLPMGRQQLNSPVSMSHQSIIYTESIMNNEGCEQMSSKTPTLIYAMSPNPIRYPMHFRGNSLPVYPVNQLQNPANLKSFQHRFKPQRQEHRNQQHPLSSYQDISLLQATLRRHNHQSIIMNTDPNPMLTYRHPDTNRLICSRNQIHYKTFHTPQHQDDLLISPKIIYTDNLKVCLPNKSKHHHRHHHSPLPLKDEQECQQLLVKNQDDVIKDNDHNGDENVTSGDHEPSNNSDNNNSNNDSVNTTITVDHSEEIPIYVKSSKNSHRKPNISVDNETDYIDNLVCNDKPENVTFQSFQYTPTTNSPLPLIIDNNYHHSKEIVKSDNYDSHLISVQRLSKSDASKYTYKTIREASFV